MTFLMKPAYIHRFRLHRHVYYFNLNRLSLKEFETTETELMDMAAAAKTGFSNMPKKGYRTPAAMGIPMTL